MKRQSLRNEIVRLYEEGKTVSEIARQLGCSKPNVSMAIKRALSWNQTISPPLPASIVSWIMDEAAKQDKSPAVIAREIIINHYHKAKQRKANETFVGRTLHGYGDTGCAAVEGPEHKGGLCRDQ